MTTTTHDNAQQDDNQAAVPSAIIVEETIGQHYEHVGCGGLIKAPIGEEGFCYGCEKRGKVVLGE